VSPDAASRRIICTAAAVVLSIEAGWFGTAHQTRGDPVEFLAPWDPFASEGQRVR
jgi:hypothetical protein